jgi:glycosyltransferase involved in cell wall biosynthesis
LRVALVNTFDLLGGAARAAYRLHGSLLGAGVDSRMVVQNKQGDGLNVIGPSTKLEKALGRVRPAADALPLKLYGSRGQGYFSAAWLPRGGILDKIEAIVPDVVHLHWVGAGMMSIEAIGMIRRPIVWSLHDMWPFTGGCHYDGGCGRYQQRCHACPALGSARSFDLSSLGQQRKIRSLAKIRNLTVVGMSRWLCDCARDSVILGGRRIRNLPNPIDTSRFTPIAKAAARQILRLPDSKRLVLFGALGPFGEKRKGFRELSRALFELSGDDVELLVVGATRPRDVPELAFPVRYLGHVHDDVSLQLIYSAADVVVVPSLQENLSNAIMESLSCGTPVVAFAIGGNGDMIEHLTNGYLAPAYDPVELARGIEWVLRHPSPRTLAERAREKVVREFDSKVVAKRYLDLYRQVVADASVTV